MNCDESKCIDDNISPELRSDRQKSDQIDGDKCRARTFRSLSLNDIYALFFWPYYLPRRLTTTIMNSLNWMTQLERLQNIVNNTLFRRRNSTPLVANSADGSDGDVGSSLSTDQSKTLAKLFNDKTLRTLKSSELIELENFGVVELDNSEAGVGHDFERYQNDKPTWCDACANFLSPPVMNSEPTTTTTSSNNTENNRDTNETTRSSTSTSAPVATQTDHLMRIYIQCKKCKYVCHLKCHSVIRIDCRPSIFVDNTDASSRLRTKNSKSRNTRHRNSVRFDGPIFGDSLESPPETPSREPSLTERAEDDHIEENIPEPHLIDSNNNCNNDEDDEPPSSSSSPSPRLNISESDDLNSSSIVRQSTQDSTTMFTSFDDDSTTCGPDSQSMFTSVDTLSESVFVVSDSESTSSGVVELEKKNHSSESVCSAASSSTTSISAAPTYNTNAELLVPSLIVNLREKILKYNERIRSKGSGLGITLIDEEKQLFRGFLKVQMNLTRPINVVAGKRPPSIYDIINEQQDEKQNKDQRRTLTSFYMPRDTVKNIHITSENSTLHVIKEMLKKFKVVDNPQKFALYLRRRFPDGDYDDPSTIINQADKQYEKAISDFLNPNNTQNSLKRLNDHEKPLILQLEFDSFAPGFVDIVLQENDNADICWHAFEVPELKNFLKILDREEAEHLCHVKAHFNDKKRLIAAMIEREETKLSAVNISHPSSPERFNGNGKPPPDGEGGAPGAVSVKAH